MKGLQTMVEEALSLRTKQVIADTTEVIRSSFTPNVARQESFQQKTDERLDRLYNAVSNYEAEH